MKLWRYIKEHMMQNPTQQICENQASLSFEETAIWAEEFSKKLIGIKCCAILCSNEMAAAMSLLACFAAEVTAVPLSMRYGASHRDKILNTISPDAIIMDDGGKITVYSIKESQYIEPQKHPALIMCTSGTTGKPKGVMLSEKNILTNICDIADYFNIGINDSILISRPIYHSAVLTGEFLLSLIKGCKIHFCSEKFNPAQLLELIKEYRITTFCGTPTLLSFMARFNKNILTNTLKHICISGECMNTSIGYKISEAFPTSNIYHVYGLTETCPRVSYMAPQYFNTHPDCVGTPLKSVSIKIIDKSGRTCGINKEGILYVKGDNVMIGYYQDPRSTRKVLKDGWLCTGDIAVINNAGFLKIKGRNDDLIIKAGMNIYPAEIEAELRKDKRVKEVLAYGFDNKFGVQIGIKVAGDFNCIDEIKQLCASTLPSFQVPSIIHLVDEIPKTASGKILRRTQQ